MLGAMMDARPFPLCRKTLALVTCLLVSACAQIPAVQAFPPSTAADPPRLLPIDDLLAQAKGSPVAEARAADLAGRAARLRARAALMQGPVHDPATRARLAQAIRAGRA
jgi:hypothetical protein